MAGGLGGDNTNTVGWGYAEQANKQMCGWQSAPQQAMMWGEKSSNSCTVQEVATGGQEGATRTQGVSALAGVGLVKLYRLNFGWTWARHMNP